MTDEQKLREFAQAILEDWVDFDMTSGDIEELAEKCGLLEPHIVDGPCDRESCNCAEYDDFPMTCYRKTKLLLGDV